MILMSQTEIFSPRLCYHFLLPRFESVDENLSLECDLSTGLGRRLGVGPGPFVTELGPG